jgi:hypothetical protein
MRNGMTGPELRNGMSGFRGRLPRAAPYYAGTLRVFTVLTYGVCCLTGSIGGVIFCPLA